MTPWYPRIDEVRSSGWSGTEQQGPDQDQTADREVEGDR